MADAGKRAHKARQDKGDGKSARKRPAKEVVDAESPSEEKKQRRSSADARAGASGASARPCGPEAVADDKSASAGGASEVVEVVDGGGNEKRRAPQTRLSTYTRIRPLFETGLRRSVLDACIRRVAEDTGLGFVSGDEVGLVSGDKADLDPALLPGLSRAPYRIAGIGHRQGGKGHYLAVCFCIQTMHVYMFDSLCMWDEGEGDPKVSVENVLAAMVCKYPPIARLIPKCKFVRVGRPGLKIQTDGWSCGLWATLACVVFLVYGVKCLVAISEGNKEITALANVVLMECLAGTESMEVELRRTRAKLARLEAAAAQRRQKR